MLYVQHGFQECVMLHKPLWTKDRLIHLIIMEEAVGSSNQHWRLQQNGFPLSKRVAKISHEWRNPSTDCSDATWTNSSQHLKGVRFICYLYSSSSFALSKQVFHSAIYCQAFLREIQKEPGTFLSLAFCPSTENTHNSLFISRPMTSD